MWLSLARLLSVSLVFSLFGGTKDVIIILMPFLGMEVTAYLSDKVASISCIDITAVPFERVLGKPVGEMLQKVCMYVKTLLCSLETDSPPLSLFSRCTKSME